jgi:acetyl esterase/lipase
MPLDPLAKRWLVMMAAAAPSGRSRPAAIEHAIAATGSVSGQASSLGIDPAKLVVGGDSAGATLAAVVCQDALRHAGPAISAQCLICPVLDFEEASPSRPAFSENHLLDRVTLEADLAEHLHEDADPRISSLCATNAGPPLSIPPSSTQCARKATLTRENSSRRESRSITSVTMA